MKYVTVPLITAIAVAVTAGSVKAADENEVTPELAKKAAVYLFLNNVCGRRVDSVNQVLISDTKVFYNYDSTKYYYVIYIYFGSGDIPTWNDVEASPEKYHNDCWSFIIPSSKKEMIFDDAGHVGDPTVISLKESAWIIIKTKFPDAEIKYVSTVIQGCKELFVFNVNGREMMVSTLFGGINEASPTIGEWQPGDKDLYDRLTKSQWDAIESASFDYDYSTPGEVIPKD